MARAHAVGSRTGHTRSVALVGTYPPTACGIATFTHNLAAAIATAGSRWEVKVLRVLEHPEPEHAPEVVGHWVAGNHASFSRSLGALESFDAVVLQHEYGIFPGADGEQVLTLVDALEAPLVAVVHTVLLEPSPRQMMVLGGVLDAAAVAVVQSRAARDRLVAGYPVDPARVVVVPHGACENLRGPLRTDVPHPLVLTWGLLGPGKGIEHGIAALAELKSRLPGATYIVAGQTHPKIHAAQGEAYRSSLRELARQLGVAHQVRFDDGYRDTASLQALVRSADVVLLPYDSRDQVSSGVLVEALAAGRPVVATRFPHAEELLCDGAGILVDHRDVVAMAAALEAVLARPERARAMASAARHAARPLLWPAVGIAYRRLIDRARREAMVA
ncbi:MAG: glycosyltransferase [Actinomycetota bacterium]|nr:glycosyltransferase [Actinomycetota bacterium]